MKIFLKHSIVIFLLFVGQLVAAQENIIPEKPSSQQEQVAIFDRANMLSSVEAQMLEEKLQRYHDSTSTQIVIATIPSLKGNDIEDVAVKWAHSWGIGQKKEDNGLFILIARDDRKIDIEVGYGIEPFLTDGLAKRVIDRIITPAFKQGKYYKGLDDATNVIFDILAGEYQNNNQDITPQADFPWVFVVIIIIWVLIIILAKKNKNNGGNNRRGRSISDDIFRSIIYSSGGSSGGFGSGGFGGSSGGGFSGGFGGGGFGGGGASGGW